jgi:predicted HicB family RNase H-like nuclease
MYGFTMGKKKLNITLDSEVLEEFCNYALQYGISISRWIEIKMKEFIR